VGRKIATLLQAGLCIGLCGLEMCCNVYRGANREIIICYQVGRYLSPTFFILAPNELLDVTAYGLRSDFLSPETMPKATVEIALTKNRKLLLASVLPKATFYISIIYNLLSKRSWLYQTATIFV